jgi:hypothetical protein
MSDVPDRSFGSARIRSGDSKPAGFRLIGGLTRDVDSAEDR